MGDEMERGSGDRSEVVVVGAGQAGLAMGYFLAMQGRHFTIVEASGSIGAAWRSRWDSLVLFTPRRYNSLPGLPFSGDPDGYPGRDEVISYLERYAATFDLPVELNSPVKSVAPTDGGFVLNLGTRTTRVRAGRGCDRSIPGPERACIRSGPRAGRCADAQHGLPASERCSPRNGIGRRRWKYRIPDSRRAIGDPLGPPCRWDSADTVAAASVRARCLLVAHEDGTHQQDGRLAHWRSCTTSRNACRLESASREAPWRRDQATSRRRLGPYGGLRGWKRTRGRRGCLGNRIPIRLRLD